MKCETIICGVGFKLLISISTSALGFRWACRIQPLLPHENVISCFRHFTFRKKRYGNEKNFIFWCIIFFTFTTDELYTFDDVSSFFPYRKRHLMLMGLPHFHITISDLELTRLPHEPRPVFPPGGQGVGPGGSRNSC